MASSGTSGRDIFNGSFLDDLYVGLGGADDIFGNGGNDLLVGDAGNDLIKGGEGDDLLLGGANNDVLISGEREPFEDEGALLGFDIPDGGDDELEGEGGNDLLIVTFDSRDVTIDGGSGVDTLRMGFDQNALQDFLDLFPSVFQTNPDLFTATIDLTGLTGQYRFNGSLLAINLKIDNIENIDGSVFSEFLGGDAGANIINGGAGNDTLEGRGGADTLNGGTGRDRARYDSSPAAVDIDLTRTSTTFAGQQIGGDAQGDRLSSIEDVNGSQFSDLIRGNSAANDLIGNGGNDTLEGRAGADTINGGAGVDTASYESSTAGVNVDLTRATQIGGHAQGDRLTSIERLIGSAFNDTLAGNSGNNFLTGGTGQDTLLGREGSDTLIGGFQNDVLDGGEGTDTASFETATASVQIILRDGTTAGRATHNTGEVDTLISIERAIGSNFADAFFGNSADNRFDGEDGDDAFFSSAGDDSYVGGDGIDTVDYSTEALRSLAVTISGFTFVNRISVQGGVPDFFDTLIDVERVVGTNFGDTFTSGAAGTIFVGRGGDDVYNVSNSGVEILESANRGLDTVNTSVTYFLRADAEVEILRAADPSATTQLTLAGSNFANTIIGNDGANTIDGEGGADILRGRKGNDVYVVGDELDRVEELVGEGADMVLSSVDFVIPSNVEQLLLRDAAVAGIGDGAANVIGGIETGLLGFGGDNLIDGGGGADRLAGGSGHDTFVLRRGEANGDIIADLTGIGSVNSDVLLFVGYGRQSEGASFQQLNANQIQINSADGLVHDVITIPSGVSIGGIAGFVDVLQRGTSGADTINGTGRDNAIFGLNGDDSIVTGDGNDIVDGGHGFDIVQAGGGNDIYRFITAQPGTTDVFFDSSGADMAVFDFSKIVSIERVENSLLATLTDGAFSVVNHFVGSAIESAGDIATGNVVTLAVGLTGGDAPGIIAGTDKGETLDGRGGNDFLYGNDGKDTLLGGDGNDLLDGGRGKDVLIGGNGDDTLIGGKSDDTFVFAPGSRHDVIEDFEKGDDRIDLTAFDTSFRRLDDDRDGRLEDGEGDRHISVDVHHGDTTLSFAGGSITIENVKALGEHDFML